MIDAKNLAKAMKKAAKGGGYKLFAPRGKNDIYLWTDQWCVVLSTDRVPRLVLATIVEQTGDLPKTGVCGVVTEDGIQTMIESAMRAEIMLCTNSDGLDAVHAAPMRYRGMLIYQAENRNVFAANGYGIGIIDRSAAKRASVAHEAKLFYTDEGECLILPCSRPATEADTPDPEREVWKALEGVNLGTVE